jgi:hypothetical protein
MVFGMKIWPVRTQYWGQTGRKGRANPAEKPACSEEMPQY